MEFDIKKTLELVKGGLLSPESTWNSYLADNPGWQKTLTLLTGPMILANVVLSVVLGRIFGGYAAYGLGGSLIEMLLRSLVLSAIGFAIAVFVFSLLAGVFKGKSDFSRAFAALSLVAIPAWLAGIVGAAIPWIGMFISLAGGIYSLVLAYRIMPLALEVPDQKRTVHFVVSIITIIVINMVLGLMLGGGAAMSRGTGQDFTSTGSPARTSSGMIGQMQRQAELVGAAQSDRFDPPGDGEVSEAQVETLVSVLGKARAAVQIETDKLKKMGEEMEDKENPSPADLVAMYQGMGSVISMQSAELEVVKTGGGNWAEHQWVKEQLRVARIQQGEGSDAIEHNYKLYEKYQDDLENVL